MVDSLHVQVRHISARPMLVVMFRPWGVLSFLLFMALAASCSAPSGSVLEDSECSPPCWRGIVPGSTSLEQAGNTIGRMADVDQKTVVTDGGISFRFTGQVAEYSADLRASGETVTMIVFNEDRNLTLSKVLAIDGSPSLVCAASWWADRRWLSVDLVNPDAGVALSYHRDQFPVDAESATIMSDDLVESVTYFDPMSYRELVATSRLIQVPPATAESCLTSWGGYGTVPVEEALRR